MGQSRRRVGQDGSVRFTAYYEDLQGKRRSAGTFTTKQEADQAWTRAEVNRDSGRQTSLRRGRQSFRRYVEEEWFPNHVIELTTREGYTYLLNRYILPELGGMRMNTFLRVICGSGWESCRGRTTAPSRPQFSSASWL